MENNNHFLKFFKKKPFWVAFGFFLALFFLLRNSFFGVVIDYTLSKKYPEIKIHFDKVLIKDFGLIFEDFHISSPNADIDVKAVNVGFKFDLYRFQFAPRLKIIEPTVYLKEDHPKLHSMLNPALAQKKKDDKFFKLINNRFDVQIVSGLCLIDEERKFEFELTSNHERSEIKKLKFNFFEQLACDSSLEVMIRPYVNEAFISIQLDEFRLHWLNQIHLAKKILADYAIDQIQGVTKGKLGFSLDRSFNIQRLDVQLDLKSLQMKTFELESASCDFCTLRLNSYGFPSKAKSTTSPMNFSGSILMDGFLLRLDQHTMLSTNGKIGFNLPHGNEVDLKGTVSIGESHADFTLKGLPLSKNQAQEDFILDFAFVDEKLKNSKAQFSFSPIEAGEWTLKTTVNYIPLDYLVALQKTLDFYVPKLNQVELNEGYLSLESQAFFHEHHLNRLVLNKLLFLNGQITFLDPNIKFSCEKLEAGLDFEMKEKKIKRWSLMTEGLKIIKADSVLGALAFEDVSVKIHEEMEKFSFSEIKGKFQQELFHLEFSGPRYQPECQFKTTIKSPMVRSLFSIHTKNLQEHTYFINAKVLKDQEHFKIDANIEDLGKGFLRFDGSLKTFDLSTLQTKADLQNILAHLQGQIKGKEVSEELYMPVIIGLKLPWQLEGLVNLDGKLQDGKLALNLSFDQLEFLSDEIYLMQNKKDFTDSITLAKLNFDILQDKLLLELDLDQAICLHKESNLWFEDVIGHLLITDTKLTIDPLTAKSENLKMTGRLDLEFLKEKPYSLSINVDEVVGRVLNLQRLARHFPEFQHLNVPFDGNLIAINDGFKLKMMLYPEPLLPDWSLEAKIEKGEFFHLGLIGLKDVSFKLLIDSNNPAMKIADLDSSISLQDITLPYHLVSPEVNLQMKDELEADFNVSLETAFLELARLKGKVALQDDKFHMHLDPNYLIEQFSAFNKNGKGWNSGLLKLQLTGKQVSMVLQRLLFAVKKERYLKMLPIDYLNHIEGLSLTIQAEQNGHLRLLLNSDTFDKIALEAWVKDDQIALTQAVFGDVSFEFQAQLKDQLLEVLKFKFSYQDDSLIIDSGSFDLVEEKGVFFVSKVEMASIEKLVRFIPILEPTMKGKVQLGGKLEVFKDKAEFQIDQLILDDKSLLSHFEIQKGMKICFDENQNITLEDFNIRMRGDIEHHDLFNIKASKLCLDAKQIKFSSPSIKIVIAPELIHQLPKFFSKDLAVTLQTQMEEIKEWDNLLKLDLAIDVGMEELKVKGSIQDGYYWIADRSYYFKDVAFHYDDKEIHLGGKVKLFDVEIAFETVFDPQERSTVIVNLNNPKEAEEKAKAIFSIHDKDVHLISMEGALFGTEFSFVPQQVNCMEHELIFSSLLALDLEKLCPYLPKEYAEKLKNLDIKETVFLKGNLLLDKSNMKNSYFKGVVSGKKVRIQDVVIQNIQALVTYDCYQLKIEEFSLADAAVLAKFDQMVIDCSMDKMADFELKNFQVYDFRPSLLTIHHQQKGKIKPFLVRHANFDEIKGNLIRTEEIKGKGHLKFINTFKRENHLIDIPLEIIARLGLDIGLLIPVRGEVDLEIKDKKVWLKELKNTFSEGRRSHFYFPNQKPCYIDFDGNIFIDVKMKQYVLFKLTQPFTLSMRGNFKKPSFSLK
jgi:hypothetical protein